MILINFREYYKGSQDMTTKNRKKREENSEKPEGNRERPRGKKEKVYEAL